MASGVTPHRSATPLQESLVTKPPSDSSLDRNLSSLTIATLPQSQATELPMPTHVTALRDDVYIHTHIALCIQRMNDVRAYIQAMALSQEARSNIGAQRAPSRIIMNTFIEYCIDHPNSFLALVCRPALDRILRADPTRPPADALNQVLSDYLGRPLPLLRFRDVEAFFRELEPRYHNYLHASYELFFKALLGIENIRDVLREEPFDDTAALAITDIARIIRKFHETHPPILAINTFSLSPSAHGQSFFMPPEFSLLPQVRSLFLTEEISSITHLQHPTLETLCLSNNRLTGIDLSHVPALQTVELKGNQLIRIDLSHNPALQALGLRDNQLTEIDLSHNPQLTYINLLGNPNLRRLDLRNNPLVITVLVDPGVEVLRA